MRMNSKIFLVLTFLLVIGLIEAHSRDGKPKISINHQLSEYGPYGGIVQKFESTAPKYRKLDSNEETTEESTRSDAAKM